MAGSGVVKQIVKSSAVGFMMGLAISDRYGSVVPITGNSMHPTFPESSLGNLALLERVCRRRFEFSHGDVVLFSSPSDHTRTMVKRIIGLPGDWIQVPDKEEILKVPEGHCWVEGDNANSSLDSRYFGAIPLALIQGRITHAIWPPSRIGQIKRKALAASAQLLVAVRQTEQMKDTVLPGLA